MVFEHGQMRLAYRITTLVMRETCAENILQDALVSLDETVLHFQNSHYLVPQQLPGKVCGMILRRVMCITLVYFKWGVIMSRHASWQIQASDQFHKKLVECKGPLLALEHFCQMSVQYISDMLNESWLSLLRDCRINIQTCSIEGACANIEHEHHNVCVHLGKDRAAVRKHHHLHSWHGSSPQRAFQLAKFHDAAKTSYDR